MKIKILIWFCLFLLFVSGCSLSDKFSFNKSDEACPVSSIYIDETYAQKLNDMVPLHLYFLSEESNNLKMEVRYIPLADAKKSLQNLSGMVVKELIAGPNKDSGLKPSIPAGTKLLNEPTFKEGNVTINLSKEFVEGLTKEKNLEKLAVFSLVNSLTEIKEIERVKFLIEGNVKKDYKGTLKMDALYPRNPTLINVPTEVETFESTEVLD
jgi:hypothetical protein